MIYNKQQEPLFEINTSCSPPSCLPTGVKSYNLIDVTRISNSWKVYLDPDTGKVYDGAEYYKQLLDMEN